MRTTAHRLLDEIRQRAWQATPPDSDDILWKVEYLRTEAERDPSFLTHEFFQSDAGEAIVYPDHKESSRAGFTLADVALMPHFEEPSMYHAMLKIQGNLGNLFPLLGLDVSTTPLIGTARTRRLNAMLIMAEEGLTIETSQPIILIDSGLLRVMDELAYYLLVCLAPLESSRKEVNGYETAEIVASRLELRPDIPAAAARKIAAFVHNDYVPGVPRGRDNLQFGGLAALSGHMVISGHILAFIIGHEYGHFYAKDLGQARVVPEKFLQGDDTTREIIYDWDAECMADRFAPQATINYPSGKTYISKRAKYLSVECFFWFLELLEVGSLIARSGSLEDALSEHLKVHRACLREPEEMARSLSHPPAALRRNFIRRVMKNSFTGNDYRDYSIKRIESALQPVRNAFLPAMANEIVRYKK